MSILTSMVHCGNTGDTIAALPSIRQYYRKTGIKPTLYLVKDHPAEYYEGAVHPVKDEEGKYVSLNADMINKLIPLLKLQPYIGEVKMLEIGEIVFAKQYAETTDGQRHINLSFIRDTFCNIPYGDIRRWYFMIYPDFTCDLSERYIDVPDAEKDWAKGKIIICRTDRYTNSQLDYSFLKEYQDNLVFAGTVREYNNFCMNFDLEIPKLHDTNFLELAQALKQSNGLISNQTMIFQIAEGLKIPRAVEICSYAPNVIPTGENAYDFLAQGALEVHFHTMNGTYDKYVAGIMAKKDAGLLPAPENFEPNKISQ